MYQDDKPMKMLFQLLQPEVAPVFIGTACWN